MISFKLIRLNPNLWEKYLMNFNPNGNLHFNSKLNQK